MICNNSGASRWHAVREAGEQLFAESLPFLLQNSFNFICRASESCFDARLEDAPQILYRVEVRK